MSCTKGNFVKITLLLLSVMTFISTPGFATETDMLDLDLSSLMQIQITSAGRKAQNLADVPAAVYVIEQDDIANSGATSIPELLRMVPGLQVARISASKWAITSRGFNGTFANKLLVQIDGRSVYTPSYSGVYWGVQNVVLEDVERIEVIRGPGATLWGANAVNGVINIITKQASDTQGGLISLGAGNQEKLLATARYGTQFGGDIYGRFYINRHDLNANKFLADKTDAHDEWEMTNGGFRIDGDQDLKNSWTLQGDFYRGENEQIDTLWVAPPVYISSELNYAQTRGYNLLGKWQRKSSEKESITAQIYYDYTNRDESYLEQNYQTFDFDLQQRFQVGESHDIVWGLGYRLGKDDFVNTYQAEFSPDNESQNTFSAFMQDEITLLENQVWLMLGTKLEHNDFTGFEVQPNIRILWKPHNDHRVWASVARAVRTPSRVEDSGNVTVGVTPPGTPPYYLPVPFKAVISGTDDFTSEELIAYEIGYRYIPGKKFSTDVALFINQYSELQSYVMDATGIYFVNNMSGNAYGLEITTNWAPTEWLETELNYSLIDLSMTDSSGSSFSPERTVEGSSPKNQLSARAQFKFPHHLFLNLWGRYTDKLTAASVAAIEKNLIVDNYYSFDANIVWQPREGLELTLAGKNLLDSQNLEFVSEQFTAPTEIERSIYAKLTLKF